MSQSNYSKIELGQRRFSFYELKYLCRTELDVHYIFTGQKCHGEKEDILTKSSFAQLFSYLGIVYSIAAPRRKMKTDAHWDLVFDNVRYLPFVVENNGSGNIFYQLRQGLDLQQQKMANTMGIDIKKLRELENGRSLPDSELLYRLFDLFGVPPWAVLQDRGSLIGELSVILEIINDKSRDKIIRFFMEIDGIDTHNKQSLMREEAGEESTYFG